MKRLGYGLGITAAVLMMTSFVHAQEATGIPEKAMKELKFLAGIWKFEARVGDEKIAGSLTCRWAKGRFCLIAQDEVTVGEGRPNKFSAGVIGWDSRNERLTHGSLGSDGSTYLAWWTVTESGDWEGESSRPSEAGGAPVAFKITKKGDNKFIFEGKTEEGEEIEAVYTKTPGMRRPGKRRVETKRAEMTVPEKKTK